MHINQKSMRDSLPRESPATRSVILPAIDRHKSQVIIKKKLNFESESNQKYQHQLSSSRHTKRKVYGKDKGDYHGYKEFFVDPHVEEFNLRFSESNSKLPKQKETDRDSKVSHFKDMQIDKDLSYQVQNALELLSDVSELPKKLQSIYNEQIKMQPPAFQNGIIALMQQTGNSYAPSVPLMHLLKQNQSILKQLLIRSKAGLGMDDLQKQAHLSFYLASIYENKQYYTTAVKFYKRFLNYARRLDDKIGIALGENRLGICEYHRGKYQNSASHHQHNIQLSNVENRFVGLYNVGITYRKLNRHDDAINSFSTSLAWANDRDDTQSISLCHGQLATTYLLMELYQNALEHYQKCLHYAKILKKSQLQLDSLNAISQISFRLGLKSSENEENILKQTLKCSIETGNKNSHGLSLCNLGIIRGIRRYEEYRAHAIKGFQNY